jgi:hypothetical protein
MRRAPSVGLLGVLILAANSFGCTGRMSRALHAFDEARYPDTLHELRELGAEVDGWSRGEQARYALYRGLSHLSLGDVRAADVWLGRAKAAYDEDFGVFDEAERGALISAWRAMGRMPGERASAELSARPRASGVKRRAPLRAAR